MIGCPTLPQTRDKVWRSPSAKIFVFMNISKTIRIICKNIRMTHAARIKNICNTLMTLFWLGPDSPDEMFVCCLTKLCFRQVTILSAATTSTWQIIVFWGQAKINWRPAATTSPTWETSGLIIFLPRPFSRCNYIKICCFWRFLSRQKRVKWRCRQSGFFWFLKHAMKELMLAHFPEYK